METKDIDGTRPSKWIPCTNLRTLAALGKLLEELGELTSIVSRAIIQGVDGVDPETGEPNLEAMTKELADVRAMCALVESHLDLDENKIDQRAIKKLKMKMEWMEMLA